MKKKSFTVSGKVDRFPQEGGWWYVGVPHSYSDLGMTKPKWGLVPATFTLGNTTWDASLLPKGDGTLFIALNQKVRKAQDIALGDTVTITYKLRV